MKLKDLFLNQWCDGKGMPWLIVTPWSAVSMTVIEATLDIADLVSVYKGDTRDPRDAWGWRSVYNDHDARVRVRYDLEDLSIMVEMSVAPYGLDDGVTLYAGNTEHMLNMLHSLSSEALRHGSSTDSGWSWREAALFAKVLVESIDHDEGFIEDAAHPFRLERYLIERSEQHPDETCRLNERDQALVDAHREAFSGPGMVRTTKPPHTREVTA